MSKAWFFAACVSLCVSIASFAKAFAGSKKGDEEPKWAFTCDRRTIRLTGAGTDKEVWIVEYKFDDFYECARFGARIDGDFNFLPCESQGEENEE